MADVADGRLWADAGAGAPLHRAGERTGPRLWLETVYGGDAPALWRAGAPACRSRVRRRRAIGRRLCDPRLGVAAPAPQGVACGFPPRRPLVRRTDGAPRRQARHGSEAGLSSLPPVWGSAGWAPDANADAGGESPTRRALPSASTTSASGRVEEINAPRPNYPRLWRRRAAVLRAARPGMARPAWCAAPPAGWPPPPRRAPR